MQDSIFCDFKPPLNSQTAKIEASRCHYCYDAPCIQACPTEIDIPSFIRKISNGNLRGAAQDILSANVMGGTCARVCPVEVLCHSACVREVGEGKSVEIGLLQRFATDQFFEGPPESTQNLFERAPLHGKKVAVVGGGPAGLSASHRLALLGYAVTLFEARSKVGGLNEYGLAPYKVTSEGVQQEIDWILGVGGIDLKLNCALGTDVSLDSLRTEFDAVFLALGLGGVKKLGIPGEDQPGVFEASRFIEKIRQTTRIADLPVGRSAVVIGGGSTAIDIAIELKCLGAESVTIVYRGSEEKMSATLHERELARTAGVVICTSGRPVRILGNASGVAAVEFERTDRNAGERFELVANQVFKAIGQTLAVDAEVLRSIGLKGGRISVGNPGEIKPFETAIPGIFAGGDCIGLGEDLTVTAVQHGKLVAYAIHQSLFKEKSGDINYGRSHLSNRRGEITQSFLAGFSTANG